MTKDQIGKKCLAQRNNLSRGEVLLKSGQIFKYTSKLPVLQKAKNISVYLPVNNEVETEDLVNFLLKLGKVVYLPKFITLSSRHSEPDSESKYHFAEFTGWDSLEKGPYGISQPVGSLSLRAKRSNLNLDVAIVPGVAFDMSGTRLGYGKGVFDRLLENSKAVKIGLAYDFQIVDKLPKEEHDLVMDLVVTEKSIVKAN